MTLEYASAFRSVLPAEEGHGVLRLKADQAFSSKTIVVSYRNPVHLMR